MLDELFHRYPEIEPYLARFQLFLFMVGMGSTIGVLDVLRMVKRPRSVLVGAGCQFILAPLVALAIIHIFNLDGDVTNHGIAVGLVLISSMPSGSLPKLFSYFGRGNLLLSASLDAFGTLASFITVPLLMKLLVSRYFTADFEVPFTMVLQEFSLFLALPFIVGMSWGHLLSKERRPLVSRCCFWIGTFVVIFMVAASILSDRMHGDYGWRGPAAVIGFCVLSQLVSMFPFRLLRWPRADRLSIGLDVTMRNINLSLMIYTMMNEVLLRDQIAHGKNALRPEDTVLMEGVFWTLLFYAGSAAVCGLVVALQFRYSGVDPNARNTETDSTSSTGSGKVAVLVQSENVVEPERTSEMQQDDNSPDPIPAQ